MKIGSIRKALLIALTALCLAPVAAHAQSTFTGVVKDTSGAVLPGVTVEAASDALIEKTRSVVTDADGGYRLVDLRPGTYSLTFSLEGFSTNRREGIELSSDFTMTINSELRVGSLEETLTVTGAAPTVDVQSTTKAQVLNREALDAIPTGRTIQGMGQLITGISLNQPDVGGSKAMQQTYMSGHGAGASQTTVQVDGLMVNGLDVDGAVQNYFNSSMSQEMVYTTSGAAADVAGGGIRLNQIPRDGGNTLSGSLFLGYQNESFQADNVTQNLRDRGLTASDGIEKLYNMEGALGGPIKKDKVWFFVSARNFVLNTLPADTFVGIPGTGGLNRAPTASTERGVDAQDIKSIQARIVWQMSQKNKLAVYNDRIAKNRGAAMTAGFDPATASIVWNSPIYTVGSVKFTSAVSSRLLFETGFSTNYERYNTIYQDGIERERNSPEWFTTIHRSDNALQTSWGAGTGQNGHVARPLRVDGGTVLRHRRAQHQGWRAGYLGTVQLLAQRQRRPPRRLPEWRPVPGDHPEHAAGLRRQAESRLRRVCAGLLDHQAPHRELRGAMGILRLRGCGCGVAGRPVRDRPPVRRNRHADLEEPGAACRSRV